MEGWRDGGVEVNWLLVPLRHKQTQRKTQYVQVLRSAWTVASSIKSPSKPTRSFRGRGRLPSGLTGCRIEWRWPKVGGTFVKIVRVAVIAGQPIPYSRMNWRTPAQWKCL